MSPLRNDGPLPVEACDFCTHAWTEHHLEAGCTHGWMHAKDGVAIVEGCYCRLAHTQVVSA